MKAILVQDDDARTLAAVDMPEPTLAADHVLVTAHATAVNRADLLQRRGLYPPPPGESDVLGLEVAGAVAAVGSAVTEWRVGDRVCALLGSGGYAEAVAVPEGMLLRIPDALDFVQAAAIPEVFYTAFLNLFLEAGLVAGERVLIHAGGSGVGTAAIQLAREAGAEVYVTAGTDDKIERCLALGAHVGINYKNEDFAERITALTEKQGIDVALDCIGGSYLASHMKILRPKGRLVLIGLMGGISAEINLAAMVQKRLRVIGSTLRSRSLEEKLAITRAFKERVLPLIESGAVRAVVDRTFPLSEADAAHAYVGANENFGKVILTVGP